MFLAIRIRGTAKTDKKIRDTLNNLHLTKNNSCMVFPENEVFSGMLRSVKDFIAYGTIDKENVKKLLENRGYIGRKKLTDSLNALNYKNIDSLIDDLFKGKIAFKNLKNMGLKLPFRLSPPSKGFKSVRKGFVQNGELGFHGDKITLLLKKML